MTGTTGFFTDGHAYERLMGRWSRAAGEVFIDWLSLPQQLEWLDVGCGTGSFTELVLDRCAPKRLSAIDPAEDQIDYARTRPGVKGATFRIGDALSLPYPDNEFDVAAMALVIPFVADATKAVSEMMRVVRPGGMAGTYIWDFFGGGFTQQPLREAVEAINVSLPIVAGHENSRMETLRRLFESAGFEQVATRTIEIEISYENFDDYWATETKLNNFIVRPIRKMNPSEIDRLKVYLRQHLPTDEGGRIAYPARANAVKGCVPN